MPARAGALTDRIPCIPSPLQVPAFAVTNDDGTPYVAEFDGKNKGFFFLDPDAAESFAARVKELQGSKASVGIAPPRPV